MDLIEWKERFEIHLENAFDYDKALERQNMNHDDVIKLRQRVVGKANVPKFIHDKHLILFLNGCKGNIDEAAKHIENYFEIKITSPELFWDRNPESNALQFSFKVQQMAPLPITPNNCYAFVHRVSDLNPQNYHYDDVFKMFMMMAEHAIFTNGPREGSIFISDWTGIKFGHLFRASISSIRKSFDFILNASPVKMKAIHILNSSYLVQILHSICKPFMSNEFLEIVHVHPSNLNFEEFFEKHVPRHCMPADYGGGLPHIEILHSKNIENLIRQKEYFLLEEHHFKQRFDEFLLINK